jgi:hypothetical protein
VERLKAMKLRCWGKYSSYLGRELFKPIVLLAHRDRLDGRPSACRSGKARSRLLKACKQLQGR